MVRARSGGRGVVRELLSVLDIAIGLGVAVATVALWGTTGGWVAPVRVLLGVPFILLVPGYCVTTALFPGRDRPVMGEVGTALSALERLTLSVGLSVVVVPLLVLFLNFTPWGITPASVRLALLAFTLAGGAAAVVQRLRLPPAERFRLRLGQSLRSAAGVGAGARPVNAVIGVLLVLSVGVAGGAVAMADEGEQFTEFYLLSENETGALVADDYPTEVGPNETESVHVGLGNSEGRTLEYTVVVEFQQFRTVDGERVVTSRTEVDRFRASLRPGESTRTEQRFAPPAWAGGDRVRLTFLLYTGTVAENPGIDDAYRTAHIWVDVPAREDGV